MVIRILIDPTTFSKKEYNPDGLNYNTKIYIGFKHFKLN